MFALYAVCPLEFYIYIALRLSTILVSKLQFYQFAKQNDLYFLASPYYIITIIYIILSLLSQAQNNRNQIRIVKLIRYNQLTVR